MHRFLVAVTAAVVLTLGAGNVASAETKWCLFDPVLTVNGRLSHVEATFDASNLPTLTGPVSFRFHVPSNVTASLALPATPLPAEADVAYDLAPWDGGNTITVTVEVTVSASARFDTVATVWRPRQGLITKQGSSQTTTTITYQLAR